MVHDSRLPRQRGRIELNFNRWRMGHGRRCQHRWIEKHRRASNQGRKRRLRQQPVRWLCVVVTMGWTET